MCSIEVIEGIQKTVSIPVMAKVRIGHFLEARVLESLGVDFIDESEVLTPADDEHHVDKHPFRSPFVCGARNLGEALRRIAEGAAMIRTKGEAGSGNIVEAVRHLRAVTGEIRALAALLPGGAADAREGAPGARSTWSGGSPRPGKLPVPNFAAGGVATPADAALCMALGAESVFVGSGIFKSEDPAARARAIVRATTHWQEPEEVLAACRGLGSAMEGIEMETLARARAHGEPGLVRRGVSGSRRRIGVLAIQGDFEAHQKALERRRAPAGCPCAARRTSTGSRRLILPGRREHDDLQGPRAARSVRADRGLRALGQAAARDLRRRRAAGAGGREPPRALPGAPRRRGGAERLRDPGGLLRGRSPRRAFEGLRCVFIRAPRLRRRGPDVEVLGRVDGWPVFVRQGDVLATTFHPELTDDPRVHRSAARAGSRRSIQAALDATGPRLCAPSPEFCYLLSPPSGKPTVGFPIPSVPAGAVVSRRRRRSGGGSEARRGPVHEEVQCGNTKPL